MSPHQGTLFFYIQLCKTNVIEEFFYFKLGNKQKHAIKQTNKNIAGDPGQKKNQNCALQEHPEHNSC